MSALPEVRSRVLAAEWLLSVEEFAESTPKPPTYFKDVPGGFLLWLRVGELFPELVEDSNLSLEEWAWIMEEVLHPAPTHDYGEQFRNEAADLARRQARRLWRDYRVEVVFNERQRTPARPILPTMRGTITDVGVVRCYFSSAVGRRVDFPWWHVQRITPIGKRFI